MSGNKRHPVLEPAPAVLEPPPPPPRPIQPSTDELTIEALLTLLRESGGSDLHLEAWSRPRVRVDDQLIETAHPVLAPEECRELIYSFLDDEKIARLEADREIEFAFALQGVGRFRTSVFTQRGTIGASLRLIPPRIPSFEELGLPPALCADLCAKPQGLVVVAGARSTGKSTTLAAMIDHINSSRDGHVITIEDPIEFVHVNRRSLIAQREVGGDTESFEHALRSTLRQDPDIVLLGEMRDRATIDVALQLAGTGHLTLAALHTSTAAQTVDWIVGAFPVQERCRIQEQLSTVLEAVLCQCLLPRREGRGRVLALEVMLASPAIRVLIRDGRMHEATSVIRESGDLGMTTMVDSLASLVRQGLLEQRVAAAAAGPLASLEDVPPA